MAETNDSTKVNLTDSDFADINCRLSEIFHSLRAIHQLALNDSGDEMNEHFNCAIAEMSRANIKGLDAVIQKLGGGIMGNFASELERA